MNERRKTNRSICDSCGGQLKKDKNSNDYICPYCGTIYYSETEPKTDQINSEIVKSNKNSREISPTIQVQKKGSRTKKRLFLVPLIILTFIFCFIFAIVTSLISFPANEVSQKIIEIQPTMLNSLPKTINAGSSIAFKGWEIIVNPEIKIDDNNILLSLIIKNWSDKEMILTFIPNDFVVYDNLGNTYSINNNNCDIDLPFFERKISFESKQQKEFNSDFYWCNQDTDIPPFIGFIPANTKNLYLQLNNFGVFDDIIIIYDL